MPETEREYLVGTVRPTNWREAGQEIDLDEKIPAKIKFVTLTMNFTQGTEEEFRTSMPGYEAKAAELAHMGAHLVRPSGAPPFMLLGYKREQEIISGWEKKYGVQMFTSGQNHVRALRTMRIKRFVGASYFPEKMNAIFARYYTEAGFPVLAMRGIDSPFAEVSTVPAEKIFEFMKGIAAKHKDSDGIYMLGSAWRTLDIIDPLEKELGLPMSMRDRHDVGRRSYGSACATPSRDTENYWRRCRRDLIYEGLRWNALKELKAPSLIFRSLKRETTKLLHPAILRNTGSSRDA